MYFVTEVINDVVHLDYEHLRKTRQAEDIIKIAFMSDVHVETDYVEVNYAKILILTNWRCLTRWKEFFSD